MNRPILALSAAVVGLGLALNTPPSAIAADAPKAHWPAHGTILRLPAIPWPNWKPGHRGLDIQMSVDGTVESPVDGRIVWVGVVGEMPSVSVLARGLKHTLMPVTSDLTKGDWIDRGDVLGIVQPSDHCALRMCLHWSVRRGSDYLDPRWVAEPLLRRGSPR
jgi:hypothetical protein